MAPAILIFFKREASVITNTISLDELLKMGVIHENDEDTLI